MDDVRTGRFKYVNDASNRPKPPMTPLSLNNHRLGYVIYKLRPRNWQFARNHPPFSIGKKGKDAKVYFEARRIDRRGVADSMATRKPVKNGCMVAYFIADGYKASGFTGQYVHALNVHIDLVFGGRNRGYVPLIIDPETCDILEGRGRRSRGVTTVTRKAAPLTLSEGVQSSARRRRRTDGPSCDKETAHAI